MAKWRKRTTTTDAPMGSKLTSTVLTTEEEAIAVAFRRHTLLPLDDCLYALQEMRLSIWAYPAPLALGPTSLFSAPRREPPATARGRAIHVEEEV